MAKLRKYTPSKGSGNLAWAGVAPDASKAAKQAAMDSAACYVFQPTKADLAIVSDALDAMYQSIADRAVENAEKIAAIVGNSPSMADPEGIKTIGAAAKVATLKSLASAGINVCVMRKAFGAPPEDEGETEGEETLDI